MNRSTAGLTVSTPDGPFSLLAGSSGVLASGWTNDISSLLALVDATLRPATEELFLVELAHQDSRVAAAAAAVESFYDGDLSAPASVPVVQHSGAFRMAAWETLRTVLPGERITYTEYASRAGRPAAVRAAAGACAMNAAALFVPCHRVLRTDGSLGGFRYGLPLKRALLDRETTVAFAPQDALF